MIPDKLLVKAFEKLDPLEVGEKITPDDVKNWDVFVECAKLYHDCFRNLKFKSDYSEITKSKQTTLFQDINELH